MAASAAALPATPSSPSSSTSAQSKIPDAVGIATSSSEQRSRQFHPGLLTPSASAARSSPPTATSFARKTSPGLAARLKALGFGVSHSPTSPSHPLPLSLASQPGRVPDSQLALLEEASRKGLPGPGAASFSALRRSRPWKRGKESDPKESHDDDEDDDRNLSGEAVGVSPPPTSSPVSAAVPRGPAESAFLVMDTHKYRLPDHTNGNGIKTQLDTRRDHLGRGAPLASPDDTAIPPPPPPPKDTPPATAATTGDYVPGLASYFTPGHQRPGSIYTLSRASFASQLAQLTSLQLPDAESLSSRVSAIPTAQAAAKALINAAEQIRSWISKAAEVIGGLDSDDDVEWAAAGGREGLDEVEKAITRFEELINVYVSAIEELQAREDIASVSSDDLRKAVSQMEVVVDDWAKIRSTLQSVKGQVEIAMEWEELWNVVLGDIQNEKDELSRLVFEMEERRHKSLMAANAPDGMDIGDLETIVEETPPAATRSHAAQSRFSLPAFPASPSSPAGPGLSQDDSSLLALFARMQPLRASIDFLPMRLSVFEMRADKTFPTACEELEMRRAGLDAAYKKLERDAESLRKELGEDRWVLVFRSSARQAQKMYESVERSVAKLKESVDAGLHLTNMPTMSKKIESFEAKKTHYGPAIERVLAIIDRGVKDRLTVNGEIVRLHGEIQGKWDALKEQMRELDVVLDDLQAGRKDQQLRDSVSSMLSNDRSTIYSGHDTPGSSPPSSVIMSSLGLDPATPTNKPAKLRPSSLASGLPQSASRRHSSLPTPTSKLPQKSGPSRPTAPTAATPQPPPGPRIPRPSSTVGNRPRWNSSTNTNDIGLGHAFKRVTTPAARRTASSVTPSSAESKLPVMRSPVARAATESPVLDDTPSRIGGGSRLSFRDRLTSPGPYSQQVLSKGRSLVSQASMSTLDSDRRASLQVSSSVEDDGLEAAKTPARPASSLAGAGRRLSLIPQPRSKREGSVSGRESPQAVAGARVAMRQNSSSSSKDSGSKPRWRN